MRAVFKTLFNIQIAISGLNLYWILEAHFQNVIFFWFRFIFACRLVLYLYACVVEILKFQYQKADKVEVRFKVSENLKNLIPFASVIIAISIFLIDFYTYPRSEFIQTSRILVTSSKNIVLFLIHFLLLGAKYVQR